MGCLFNLCPSMLTSVCYKIYTRSYNHPIPKIVSRCHHKLGFHHISLSFVKIPYVKIFISDIQKIPQ